jgi:hypothetical protein
MTCGFCASFRDDPITIGYLMGECAVESDTNSKRPTTMSYPRCLRWLQAGFPKVNSSNRSGGIARGGSERFKCHGGCEIGD